jgi:hypothetical protein
VTPPNFNAVPDAEKHPPATAVTPQQLSDSEAKVRAARTPEERAAAESAHQALCQSHNEQLRQIHLQRQFTQLTHRTDL